MASAVAARQLELITVSQLHAIGISNGGIASRRRRGELHQLHRGVYTVGSPILLPGARELAAVLATGELAFVSHRSAAPLWGLVEADLSRAVDVTVIARNPRARSGIDVHRVGDLPMDEQGERNGIPVTSAARALLDLAAQASGDELESAIAEAYAMNLTTEAELQKVGARHPRLAGAAALRAELKREGGPALTRSEAERLMKRLVREAGLPPPLTNHRVAGYSADFFWPEQRLIVEVDGYRFHGHRRAFERDRKRDVAHTLAGYRVIRITWRALTEERIAVAVTIARALAL